MIDEIIFISESIIEYDVVNIFFIEKYEIISFIDLSSKNIAHIINAVNMIKHQTYDDVKYSEIISVSTQMMNDEIKKFNKNMKKISKMIPDEYINNN